MNTPKFEHAFKDPSNASASELDDILEAQLEAVRQIKQVLGPAEAEKKPKNKEGPHQAKNGIKRSHLRHLNQRI